MPHYFHYYYFADYFLSLSLWCHYADHADIFTLRHYIYAYFRHFRHFLWLFRLLRCHLIFISLVAAAITFSHFSLLFLFTPTLIIIVIHFHCFRFLLSLLRLRHYFQYYAITLSFAFRHALLCFHYYYCCHYYAAAMPLFIIAADDADVITPLLFYDIITPLLSFLYYAIFTLPLLLLHIDYIITPQHAEFIAIEMLIYRHHEYLHTNIVTGFMSIFIIITLLCYYIITLYHFYAIDIDITLSHYIVVYAIFMPLLLLDTPFRLFSLSLRHYCFHAMNIYTPPSCFSLYAADYDAIAITLLRHVIADISSGFHCYFHTPILFSLIHMTLRIIAITAWYCYCHYAPCYFHCHYHYFHIFSRHYAIAIDYFRHYAINYIDYIAIEITMLIITIIAILRRHYTPFHHYMSAIFRRAITPRFRFVITLSRRFDIAFAFLLFSSFIFAIATLPPFFHATFITPYWFAFHFIDIIANIAFFITYLFSSFFCLRFSLFTGDASFFYAAIYCFQNIVIISLAISLRHYFISLLPLSFTYHSLPLLMSLILSLRLLHADAICLLLMLERPIIAIEYYCRLRCW